MKNRTQKSNGNFFMKEKVTDTASIYLATNIRYQGQGEDVPFLFWEP